MDVDMTNVTGKPLVDGIDELPGILKVITLCDITLLEPGQGLHKMSVGRLFGNRVPTPSWGLLKCSGY